MTQPVTTTAGPDPAVAESDVEDDGYRGPGTVTVDEVEYAVDIHLLGHFEPLDGWYRWYGRIAAHTGLDAALGGRRTAARVTTPVGSADGELSDVDPWGRYRVTGTSTPPFPVGAP